MTKDEALDKALKLALEALENLQGLCSEESGFVEQVTIWTPEAITAIKQARSAPYVASQLVQEPVGCNGAIVNGRVYADRLEHDYKFECEAGPLHLCNDWVEFRRCFEWLAVHTTPPNVATSLAAPAPEERKRQSAPDPKDRRSAWVGLTDDDKQHIEIMGGKSDVMLAEMVEAKLKEKNT